MIIRSTNATLLRVLLVMVLCQSLTWAQSPAGEGSAKQLSLAASLQDTKWIDLTHTFDKYTIYWPTEEGFKLVRGPAGVTEKGYYYAANRFVAAEHGGTHLDAPIHFFEGGDTSDQIPLERFVGQAAVIDVTRQCERNRDYQVGINDFRRWETTHQRQLVDVIVLVRTGYGDRWGDRAAYLGTPDFGADAVAKLHFPGIDPDAARWLAEHRSIKAIGIDTASIDYGQSQRFQTHVTLFSKGIPAFENVANLDKLPSSGALVIALPMKIGEGSGGPLRIIASVPR